MSDVSLPSASGDENPRSADEYYVKLKGWEYDALVEVGRRLGGDSETLAPLSEPSLKHNDMVSQVIRLLCRRDITPADFEEPIATDEPTENRFAKVSVALLPSERAAIDNRISLGEIDSNWRNHRDFYKKVRQGVVLPFVQEVSN